MTNYFDEPVAAAYDDDESEMFDPLVIAATADLLADLAGGKPALELAVGTGRIALPLSQRGVRVSGIELSEAMVARLEQKPGAEAVEVTIGDMTSTRVPGEFGLVYLVFNTIGNLLTQDDQVACFCNAAAHLAPGGYFVIEDTVPILQRLPVGEVFRTFAHSGTHLGFDEIDVVTQRMYSHHYRFEGDTFRRDSVPFRYAWPAELDLMARIAGMRLHARWADWQRAPFRADSPSHISVWQLPS